MEMEDVRQIGRVIARRRKELGLTQSELARRLLVTNRAVSKWETGATCPDVAMLAPIARALDVTTDELLSFRPRLSAREVGQLERRAERIFADEGFEAGFAAAGSMLREHPNSPALRMRLCWVLERVPLLCPAADERQRLRARELCGRLYGEVRGGADAPLAAAATAMLATRAMDEGDWEGAEELLDSLPRPAVDTDVLYPALYLRQGRLDEAERAAQTALFSRLHEAMNLLRVLERAALQRGETPRALDLGARRQAIVELFELKELVGPDDRAALLAQSGRMDEALDCFGRHAERLPRLTGDYSGHPVFPRVELSATPEQLAQTKRALLAAYETDESFAALRGEPRFQAALERLRRELDD